MAPKDCLQAAGSGKARQDCRVLRGKRRGRSRHPSHSLRTFISKAYPSRFYEATFTRKASCLHSNAPSFKDANSMQKQLFKADEMFYTVVPVSDYEDFDKYYQTSLQHLDEVRLHLANGRLTRKTDSGGGTHQLWCHDQRQ